MLISIKLGVSEFAAGLIASQLSILGYAFYLLRFDFKYIRELFKGKFTKKALVGSVFLMAVLFLVNILYSKIIPSGVFTSDTATGALSSNSVIIMFIFPVILAPIIEELAFRAGYKKVLIDNNDINSMVFLIFSSLMFGMLHWQPGTLGFTIVGLVTIMGYIKAYVYLRTDNILITIGGHMLYNAFIMIIAFNMV